MQVPAGFRIFIFFSCETFAPLVVIFSNKSYQQFAMKKIRECFFFPFSKLLRLEVGGRQSSIEENKGGSRTRPRWEKGIYLKKKKCSKYLIELN